MHSIDSSTDTVSPEPWYKFGVGALLLEMALALAVSAYSLSMTFHGVGSFLGKH